MGTYTISTSAQDDERLEQAFGHHLGVTDGQGQPRSATAQEIKTALVDYLRRVVVDYERAAAVAQVSVPAFDPE
ncbi:MAG: hypothetical protein ACPHN2_04845 [Sinimarinibacterium flocculans]|uniref:hypothetical protein n=1 Tax=Sinimarinibacterium flocculans TaxID=985250 RepID=UPI003C4F5529